MNVSSGYMMCIPPLEFQRQNLCIRAVLVSPSGPKISNTLAIVFCLIYV